MTSRMNILRVARIAVSLGIIFVPMLLLGASTIAGKIVNGSTKQPAAGDEVILLHTGNQAEEAPHATVDAQGSFSLTVHSPGPYVLRAIHQGANYDLQVAEGEAVTMQVFDSAPAVEGIAGTIAIIRMNLARKGLLHVSQMYSIRNQSSPSKTQTGGRKFQIYLPPNGTINSVLAAGPSRIAERIVATPVKGEPGHYALDFPLRPGDTNFAVNYDLPYDGHQAFHPRLAYGVQQLAIMFPQSMKFASTATSFHPILDENGFTVQAATQVLAGEAPSFEISGNGVLSPSLGPSKRVQIAKDHSPAFLGVPAALNGANAGHPDKTDLAASRALPGSLPKQAGFVAWAGSLGEPIPMLLLSLFVATIGVAAFLWRIRKRPSPGNTDPSVDAPKPLHVLEGLKEEFIQLETDRLNGVISMRQYNLGKQGIEKTMRQVFKKASGEN